MRTSITILLTAFILTACSSIVQTHLKNYNNDVEVYEHSIEHHPNGNIKKIKLSKATQINGFECIRWVHFYENGNIDMYQTAVDIPINDYQIPSQSFVFVSETEPFYIKQSWLSKDTEIQGIICSGKGKISTSFHPNGNLRSFYIDDDRYIQGYPCKGGVFKNVIFDSAGKINSFTLAKDTLYKSTLIPKGSRIMINNNHEMLVIED
jgi:hypothetical protein